MLEAICVAGGESVKHEQGRKDMSSTYGGFQYRFSYDDSQNGRLLRRGLMGRYRVFAALAAVVLLCGSVFAVVVVRHSSRSVIPADSQGALTPEKEADKEAAFIDYGDFVLEDLSERAISTYHVPQGVRVTYVSAVPSDPFNNDKLRTGDVILSVDEVNTPDLLTCGPTLDSLRGEIVHMLIYREGKYVGVNYNMNE